MAEGPEPAAAGRGSLTLGARVRAAGAVPVAVPFVPGDADPVAAVPAVVRLVSAAARTA